MSNIPEFRLPSVCCCCAVRQGTRNLTLRSYSAERLSKKSTDYVDYSIALPICDVCTLKVYRYNLLQERIVGVINVGCGFGAVWGLWQTISVSFSTRQFTLVPLAIAVFVILAIIALRERGIIPFFTSLRTSKICKFLNNGKTLKFWNTEYQKQFDLLNSNLSDTEHQQIEDRTQGEKAGSSGKDLDLQSQNIKKEDFVEQEIESESKKMEQAFIELIHKEKEQTYIKIINEFLVCPKEREIALFQSWPELINLGLSIAISLHAKRLVNLGQGRLAIYLEGKERRLSRQLHLLHESSSTPLRNDLDRHIIQKALDLFMAESVPQIPEVLSVAPLEFDLKKLRDYQTLWQELIDAASRLLELSEPIIHMVLARNLALLDLGLVYVMQKWAEDALDSQTQYEETIIKNINRLSRLNSAIYDFSRLNSAIDKSFSSSDRAINLEEFNIAAYNIILSHRTRQNAPAEWALMQGTLGIRYANRIRGDRAENIEAAIQAWNQAHEVYTRHDFPEQWAQTHENIGSAYNIRVRGDRAENIEAVLKAYNLALEVYTRDNFPKIWAEVQERIANAYIDRILGDKAENIEAAIDSFNLALNIFNRNDFPINWASAQKGLAHAYIKRILGDKAQNEEDSLTAEKLALEVYTLQDFPEKWAFTQMQAGILYSDRIRGDKAQNKEDAIAAYKLALEVFTKQDFPEAWAMTQKNLADAYNVRIRGDRSENLENAITAYKLATEIRTRQDFPQEWASIQKSLGIAYDYRIQGERAENIEAAISACQFALEVFTCNNFPEKWASTQHCLAVIYIARIRGDKAKNIEAAINALNLALQVFTRNNFPEMWASTQKHLGIAYDYRIQGERAENIEAAIEAFNLALEVYKRQDFPEEWASTHLSLALIYSKRIRGDKAENVEAAINANKCVLQIRTRKDFPEKWASAMLGLALLYKCRIRGELAENIEVAIEAYKLALEVYTRQDFPEKWASTQLSLANTFIIKRIKGDRSDNIELGIESCALALKIYIYNRHYCSLALGNQKEFPEECASVYMTLAIAYINRTRGDKVENIKAAIDACNAALEVFTRSDFPEEWASTQNILASAYSERISSYRDRVQIDPAENIEAAIKSSKLALEVYTRQDFPEDWAMTLINLAVYYTQRIHGDRAENIETAIEAYKLVLKVYTRQNFPEKWATTHHNLALAYAGRIRGDRAENIEAAIKACNFALEIINSVSFPYLCWLTASNLGDVGFTNNLPEIAIQGYTTALAAVDNYRSEAIDPARKEEILSQAIKVYAKLIQLYVDRGDYAKAIEYCDRSKARNLAELLTIRNIYPQGDISPEVNSEIDRLRGAIATAERQLNPRRRGYNQYIKIGYESGETRTVNYLNYFDASSPRSKEENAARDHLFRLKQELDNLVQTEIQPQASAFSLTQKVQPLTFDQLRDTIHSDLTVILSWHLAGNKLIAFLISSNSEQPTLFPYPDDALEQLNEIANNYVNSYNNRGHLTLAQLNEIDNNYLNSFRYRNNKQAWRDQLPDLLQQFSNILQIDRLLETIFQLQSNCDQLILIPHRFLHILPLHALPIASQGNYFLDAFPNGIRFAPSLQVLGLAQQRQKTDLDSLLAIQNPTEDLPFTDFEVSILRRFFTPNDAVLVHTAATTEALRNSQIERSNCLHFACHGYFNFDQPQRSALLLAGSQTDNNINESNCLTLLDLFQLNLQKCGLVVLSSCETGLTNFNSQSDEFVGLPSGFLFAGSPTVISSLWTVDDLATSLLMVSFYRHLKEVRLPPALALKQAQNDLRLTKVELVALADRLNLDGEARTRFDRAMRKFSDDDRPYASPFYWAAFQAIGK